MTEDEKNLVQDGLLKARKENIVTTDTGTNNNSAGKLNNVRTDSNTIDNVVSDIESSTNTTSNIKWYRHNKCRNPGNTAGGPWCYTKNPNVRWQYCTKPDYSNLIARSILLITFLFCFILSYLAVKAIFRGGLFSEFMARMTGGQFTSGAIGK